jgi:hypothetical protein
MYVMPSSSGWRRTSRTWRRHSGRSSRKSTPLWASDTSPGSGTCPPPISPTSEIVWCGARNGRVVSRASASVIFGRIVVSRRASIDFPTPGEPTTRTFGSQRLHRVQLYLQVLKWCRNGGRCGFFDGSQRHWCNLRTAPPATLGLLQVGGVEALGAPAVDPRQQRTRFAMLALLLPQALRLHMAMTAGFLMNGGERSPSGLV